MSTTAKNPWLQVPRKGQYVLDGDRFAINEFNQNVRSESRRLLIDELMPEPFIGHVDAPVLLLSNNPGAGKGRELRAESRFQERIWANLCMESSAYPFYYLHPEVIGDPNGRWWERRVKWLIDYDKEEPETRPRPVKDWPGGHRRFSREVISKAILNVVFFPYPSVKFGDDFPVLESQEFGFELVRQAMRRNAFIVFMRTANRWEKRVDKLGEYKRKCQVGNVQNPTVSPNNLKAFEEVVKTIGAWVDGAR